MKDIAPTLLASEVFDHAKTGKIVRRRRRELGIKQSSLALAINMKASQYNELEFGKRLWNWQLFNRAKAALERLSRK